MQYAIVDGTGHVLNIVEWDGAAEFDPGAGNTLEALTPELAAKHGSPVAPAAATPQTIFSQKLMAGIAITSTATPALNGTYSVDDNAQRNLIALYTSIKGGDGLPGGGATFFYRDLAGAPHAFAAGDITALAKAVRDYVYALGLAAAEPTPAWPAATATIP